MKNTTIAVLIILALSPIAHGNEWDNFFPNGLIDANGNEVNPSTLDDKIVCLYFSASWCGSCHAFTPKLKEFYQLYKDRVEIVLVSKDHSYESFMKYLKKHEMPWLAVKWANYKESASNEPATLIKKYRAGGIPKLVVLSPSFELIESEARMQIAMLPEDYIKSLQERDPTIDADRWKSWEEENGRTVNEKKYTKKVEHYKNAYLKKASELELIYKRSLKQVNLTPNSSWDMLVSHYYHSLRTKNNRS